jgi:hypothetical protein
MNVASFGLAGLASGLAGLASLLVAGQACAQADTIPPPTPTALMVSAPKLQAAGMVFTVTWKSEPDQPGNVPVPLYRWSAGFNDGSGPLQGSVAAPVLMLTMPYHTSGAATTGFVCVLSEDAAGNLSPGVTCTNLAIPAKPSLTLKVEIREPTTKADGTPLKALARIRVYWRIDDGPESVVNYPVSSPTGGELRQLLLTVPATPGTLSVTITAVDTAGNESSRSAPATKVIAPD